MPLQRLTLTCVGVLVFSVTGMAVVPGRRADHSWVNEAETSAAPQGTFSIGPLRWDMSAYGASSTLTPLREFFNSQCAGLSGIDAATCVSNTFVRTFPDGAPTHEFFDFEYDPAGDLASHLGGEPGHCVTRSGLLAAVLLASGVPARQVQVTPSLPFVHNADEVYDDRWGSVLFDPRYGTAFRTRAGRLASARIAVIDDTPGTPIRIAAASVIPGADGAISHKRQVLYPDPWLYTRVGHRAARWPLRNHFVDVETTPWSYGAAQLWLRRVALAATIGLIAVLVSRRRRRSVGESARGIAGRTAAG